MRHQPKPNSTPEPYPHLACTVWVATEASKFTAVSNEASLWMAPDGYLSKLTLCPVPSESKKRGGRQSRPISSEQARPAAGHSSMGESSGQAGPGPDELPPAAREIQWHQVRGIKALERRFEITLKLVGSGRFITLRLLERADFERWLRAVRSWEDEILVRQARLFPPMADEKMRYQVQGTLARAVQGLLGTSSTRRHFFRLRWTADLNALVLSYTEEFPTETSAWRTVEWSERVRIHASSEELSCLTIVLKSSGALVHLRADAPADFVSWLANLQAWDAYSRLSHRGKSMEV